MSRANGWAAMNNPRKSVPAYSDPSELNLIVQFKNQRYYVILLSYLVEIRFGASQDDGKGQIEDECGEADDTQTEETSPAN